MTDPVQAQKIQDLKAIIPTLSERDQIFASSLVAQGETRALSPKQMFWVDKLTKMATTPIAVAAQIDSVQGVFDLLKRPGSRLKWPKIRFLVTLFGFDVQAQFRISLAGEKSRYPGTINVVSNEVFYGRIHTDGRYEAARNINPEDQANIISELKRLASDPEGVAREFGKKTGHCCFCSLPLDDERSVKEGYGPVCAKHYKLPWGGKIAPAPVVVPAVPAPAELTGQALIAAAAALAGTTVEIAGQVYQDMEYFDGEPVRPELLARIIKKSVA